MHLDLVAYKDGLLCAFCCMMQQIYFYTFSYQQWMSMQKKFFLDFFFFVKVVYFPEFNLHCSEILDADPRLMDKALLMVRWWILDFRPYFYCQVIWNENSCGRLPVCGFVLYYNVGIFTLLFEFENFSEMCLYQWKFSTSLISCQCTHLCCLHP